MLQKLQQILMAQQQRQQQRQLHELLLQLLAVHKLATNDNISPPIGMCICCMKIFLFSSAMVNF